ncbi:hypothetical protein FCV25MIE_19687 [Fagus crenata]
MKAILIVCLLLASTIFISPSHAARELAGESSVFHRSGTGDPTNPNEPAYPPPTCKKDPYTRNCPPNSP